MSTNNQCFEQKYEKYQSFLSENFQILEVELSIYLNRSVFVTGSVGSPNGMETYFTKSEEFMEIVICRASKKD